MKNVTYINIVPDITPPHANGQWQNMSQWGISVATTYDPNTEETIHWSGETLENNLIDYLKSRDLVIGFNWRFFDKDLLSGYGNVDGIPSFSLMDQVESDLNVRLSLQNLGNSNGINSTKVNLINLLKNRPDTESIQEYNMNKINTMVKLIKRAVDKQTLFHFQTGDTDRSPRRFVTSHWSKLINNATQRF